MKDSNWLLTNVGDYTYTTSPKRISILDAIGRPQTRTDIFSPFIFERTRYFNELVPQFYLQFNDVVNSKTDAVGDLATAQLDAINRIGNFKLNSKRNIFHLTDGFNQETLQSMLLNLDAAGKIQITDPDYEFPLYVPLYPPNELVAGFKSTTVGREHEYWTSRIQLTATDSGYKHYIKSNNPSLPVLDATQRWAYETRETSSYKNVVISPFLDDGTSVNLQFIQGAVENGFDMSSATGSTAWDALGNIVPAAAHKNIDVPDIEAVMDRVYGEAGDAFGTFLGEADSHIWINKPAHLKVQYFKKGASHPTDTNAYEMTLYKLAAVNDPLVEGTHWWKDALERDTGLWLLNGVVDTDKEINRTFDLTAADYGIKWIVGKPDTTGFQMNLREVTDKGIWNAGLADGTLDIEVDEAGGTITITAGDSTITVNKDGDIDIVAATGVVNYTTDTFTITGDLNVTGDLDVGAGNVIATAAGALSVAGKLDVEGAADILGITSHGV